MDTPTFTDIKGDVWTLQIVVSDIDRVRKRVVNKEGTPVDLLAMAEHGDFSTILVDAKIFPTVVFWLIYDQVMERFSVEQYDADHVVEYEVFPNEKRINPIQKAANWFGERIGGDQIESMGKAFEVALLNFMTPRLREKMIRVMQKQEKLNEAILEKKTQEAEDLITAGLDALSGKRPPLSELTSAAIRSESLSECLPPKKRTTGRKSPSKRASLPIVGQEKGKSSKSKTSPTAPQSRQASPL